MKTLLLSIIVVFSTFQAKADEGFMKVMKESIEQFKTSKSPSDIQDLANKFERIGSKESAEWLPNYYAAFSYFMLAIQSPATSKDAYLDKADIFIEKMEIQENKLQDEIEVLKAEIAMQRISVDGASRWMKYGQAFGKAIAIAEKINPENPRVYLTKAQNIYYTPEQFGGGKKKACPDTMKSLEKYKIFKAISDIAPNWGMEQAKEMSLACE